MTIPNWLTASFPDHVSADQLKLPATAVLAELLSSDDFDGARLVEARRSGDGQSEALVIEADVGIGQAKPVHDIRLTEALAVCLHQDQALPNVYPLRADFPQHVSHLNIALRDEPRSLCLFEGAREDILRTYTPQRLLARIRWWLTETAYGRLHGNDQPIDPIFISTDVAFILPAEHLAVPADFYFGVRQSDAVRAPVLLTPAKAEIVGRAKAPDPVFSAMVIETAPVAHGRIRWWPRDLDELLSVYAELGADLEGELRQRMQTWSADQSLAARLELRLLLIVRTPLRLESGDLAGVTTRGFLTTTACGRDVATALSALASAKGYTARIIGQASSDKRALSAIRIGQADVHQHFGRSLARIASGRSGDGKIPISLIGAGALGSQVALAAARGGFGVWTIADKDFLLPHNLARHGLAARHVGAAKAQAVAHEIKLLLGDDAASGIIGDVMSDDVSPGWHESLAKADRVLDASANVSVARWLARQAKTDARIASCFLTPSGRDLVTLSEGAGRSPRLDQLEMSYYWQLVIADELHGHLSVNGQLMPTGSCRSPSWQLAQSRLLSSAAIAGDQLCESAWPDGGLIAIWRSDEATNEIRRYAVSGETYREIELKTWKIVVRDELIAKLVEARNCAGNLETGGILVGTWDRERKIIYVVGHFDAPPDSVQTSASFKRGAVGVFKTIVEVEAATAANLSYVGEWHSHPIGVKSQPSSDDRILLNWISDALRWSDAPSVMAIVADDGVRFLAGTRNETETAVLAPPPRWNG